MYDAAQPMRPDTVARSILHVIDLPTDTTIHDLTIRPTPHHKLGQSPPATRLMEGRAGLNHLHLVAFPCLVGVSASPRNIAGKATANQQVGCGFTLDVDHQPNDEFRVAQITPPGSACSITIGKGATDASPGSYRATTSS